MKKIFVLIIVSLFIVVGNVAAADLTGTWTGTMYCSDDYGATGEDFTVEITQTGDFFTTYNDDYPSETCGGVIDGGNISMTCRNFVPGNNDPLNSITFAYGELKGKVLYVINHVPGDAKTCKGTATMVPE